VAILQVMMIYGILINLGLIAFNLMPIPPLDGSHVMKYLLPGRLAIWYQQLARFGFLILIVLISFGKGALELWMRPAYIVFSLLFGAVDSLVLPRAHELFG
jgi:Zn-dependent protease